MLINLVTSVYKLNHSAKYIWSVEVYNLQNIFNLVDLGLCFGAQFETNGMISGWIWVFQRTKACSESACSCKRHSKDEFMHISVARWLRKNIMFNGNTRAHSSFLCSLSTAMCCMFEGAWRCQKKAVTVARACSPNFRTCRLRNRTPADYTLATLDNQHKTHRTILLVTLIVNAISISLPFSLL